MPRRTTSIVTPVAHLVGPGTLKVVNGRLAFTTGNDSPVRLDPAALRELLCYGNVGVSDEAMQLLLRHDVQVAWLTPAGHVCRGRLVRSTVTATTLRIQQHLAFHDPEVKHAIARDLVAQKIQSQIDAARHYQRHGSPRATATLAALLGLLQQALASVETAGLRGIEGAAANAWFDLLGELFRPPWRFDKRVRRPPTDPVNALLSLGYTWLLTRTAARCEALGLEVNLGALHDYRPGRPSLACDLIEPLRVPAVDRWVITVCNKSQLTPDDFISAEGGGIRLQSEVFRRMLGSWEEHWLGGGPETLHQQVLDRMVAAIRSSSPALPTGVEEA